MPDDVKTLQAYLGKRRSALAEWAQGLCDPAHLIRFALLDYSTSKGLQKCSHESIYLALIAAAQVGLAPDGVESAIVPYATTATWQPMYQGLIRKALEHPDVLEVDAEVVHKNDRFLAFRGTESRIEHELAIEDRGEVRAAYAIARIAAPHTPDGWFLKYEVVTKEDIDKVAEKAQKSPAWKDWRGQMARKIPIKRMSKFLPKTAQFAKAVRLDDLATAGDIATYRQVIDAEVEEGEG